MLESRRNDNEASVKGHRRYVRTVSFTSESQSSPTHRSNQPETSHVLLKIPRPRVNSLSPCDNVVIPCQANQYKEEWDLENERYDKEHDRG